MVLLRGGDSSLECNLDQIQSHLWPPSPPEKMEGNNYHQWRYASDEKMGGGVSIINGVETLLRRWGVTINLTINETDNLMNSVLSSSVVFLSVLI